VSMRLISGIGALAGLVVSGCILALLWFGVAGVLITDHLDLMYVLWPSSVVLVGGWHATTLGILITSCAVAANCLMYSGMSVLLAWSAKLISRFLSTRGS
jgi:hypothetical protein